VSLLSYLRDRRAKRLEARARELIDLLLGDEAMPYIAKLRPLREHLALELEARAYMTLERHYDAIRVLRESLASRPDHWRTWSLLGACLSILGRFDDASAAYDRAAACSDCDPDLLAVNRELLEMERLDPASEAQVHDRFFGERDE
jgi:Flp pilus assembly protein TadD